MRKLASRLHMSDNTHICNLDKIFKDSLLDPKIVIVIFDASIKNNIAILISHVCFGQNTLAKTIYHAINITSCQS